MSGDVSSTSSRVSIAADSTGSAVRADARGP